MTNLVRSLQNSLYKGFIDDTYDQTGNYPPELLVNNTEQNESVLSTLVEELENCNGFLFSVAFITESGLATLKSHLLDLKQKGIRGRILTSTYLSFNQPKVFRELLKLENVDVRLTNLKGFHSKGYIFNHDTHYSLIVGSSNLTAHALKVNYEWNVKLTSHANGEIVSHFKKQFEDIWSGAEQLSEEWINVYEKDFTPFFASNNFEGISDINQLYSSNPLEEALKITPNKMQESALEEIQAVRGKGEKKGLVISATGTGKTYLSAFDVRRFQPKRMLFIVHREQILKQATEDFRRVLGGLSSEFGILSGSSKNTESKYLFATIQTISKLETLHEFDRNAFDYILIDEVHKAGAESYLRVIDYFEPQFLMGMTATPERTDDFNIFELFDYNIAYEIRLQEALEEDMLSPFHYFGVTDLEIDGEVIEDTTVLNKLVTDERVDHIIDKVEYYGYAGEMVKGLMFCSRKEEARKLSQSLNDRGLRTVALTGDDSLEDRNLRVNQLENGMLDYILTVDIFNEGIDIPSINQVVMLRQTQSSIIFIQQLGRGLRKYESKDYLTVIDFIGNYKNNYLIPIALSGDNSLNKDNTRRNMKDTSYIKGISTINFEEVAKQRVFKAINESNLSTLKILRDAYVALKNKIGRIPYLYDYITNHSIDPEVIAKRFSNYYQFLQRMKEDIPPLTSYEDSVLTMLSEEILNGKRPHEVVLLEYLLEHESISRENFVNILKAIGSNYDDETISSVQRIFDLSFFTKANQEKYGSLPIITLENDRYTLGQKVSECLSKNPYFKKMIIDLVNSTKEKSKSYMHKESLTLHQKYSRKDVCKLLNWHKDETSTMYGYKTKHNTCPIFITYHKGDEVDASVDYGDELLSEDVLLWYTRSNRTLESKEVQAIVSAKENNIDLHIFMKKDDDEGTEFYYLGKAVPDRETVEQSTMKDKHDKQIPVVHMNLLLRESIEHKLYTYLIAGANN